MTDAIDRRPLLFFAGNAAVDRTIEVEKLLPGSIHRPAAVLALPGGKGVNAARAAHTLGANVIVVAVIGGHAGAWIAERLVEEGVKCRLVTIPGETRSCVSVFDRSDGRLTEFYESGAPVEPSTWDQVLEIIEGEIEHADLAGIICSGSVPPDTRSDLYAQVVRMGRGHEVPVMVDAAGPILSEAVRERPAVVKVNRHEAATASGLDEFDDRAGFDAVNWLVERGAVRAVVTLGVDGALGLDSDDEAMFRVEPVAIHGPYPVGSGDAFMAGLALSTIMQEPFKDALSLGMAAAIANAGLPGAGRLDASDVARLRSGVQVNRVSASVDATG